MISRDWQCANKACRATFHSYERHPCCPSCGNVRVSWVPGGGHVGSAKALDASLKALAKTYGMTDINSPSPSRREVAMPKHDPVEANSDVYRFRPGFAAPFSLTGRPTCEPSRERVDFKVKMEADRQLTPQLRAGPQIGADNWKTMRRQYKP